MRIVTGLETAKGQVKNKRVKDLIQDGINYIGYLEQELELLEYEVDRLENVISKKAKEKVK